MENQGLDTLEKDKRVGKLYTDNLCYFRCLAQHQGCSLKNLERKKETKESASHYFAMLKIWRVSLACTWEICTLSINSLASTCLSYSLAEDLKVELVHRPTNILLREHSQEAFQPNLYDDYFSYIKHQEKYSWCFTCQQCHASFAKAWCLFRHKHTVKPKSREFTPAEYISSREPVLKN